MESSVLYIAKGIHSRISLFALLQHHHHEWQAGIQAQLNEGRHNEILCVVLGAMNMTADYNCVPPPRDKPGDTGQHDRFTQHTTNVTAYHSVWRFPHFCFRFTLFSSGVIEEHMIETWCFLAASAASSTTPVLVSLRLTIPSSKHMSSIS